MIDTEKLSQHVLRDVAQNMGWEPSDADLAAGVKIPDEYIIRMKELDRDDFFEKWCVWNGFLGSWHSTILSVVDELDLAEYL